MTEPLSIRLDELRRAARDLHAIAIRLRADLAALASAAGDDINVDWHTTDGQRQVGRRATARLVAVVRDLDLTARALDEAADAYRAADDRSAARHRAVPW